jgi:hypothetical protein
MPKILAIIFTLVIAAWFSLPSSANAAPLSTLAEVGEDIVGPSRVKGYRRHHRHVRGDYFRGQPWGPGFYSGWAPFFGPAGYYGAWRPYRHYSFAYADPYGPYRW